MSGRMWRWQIVGLVVGVVACKPDAPTETSAAGFPQRGPTPVSELNEDPTPAESAAIDETSVDKRPETVPALVQTVVADTDSDASSTGEVGPELPYRVLMLGDSLVATGIGALLEQKLDAHPHVVCYRKGKSSSGLARPDFYDWIDQAKRQVEFREPDLVIVLLGGNDGQDLIHRTGRGARVGWDKQEWPDAYRTRVDAFLAEISGPQRKVLWVGLPTMGLRSLEKKLTLIRGVQQQAVAALGEIGVYVDTIPLVTDANGQMLKQAEVGPRHKVQPLRSEDRIHFTMAGSEYLASHLYPEVLKVLALPDVQADP